MNFEKAVAIKKASDVANKLSRTSNSEKGDEPKVSHFLCIEFFWLTSFLASENIFVYDFSHMENGFWDHTGH